MKLTFILLAWMWAISANAHIVNYDIKFNASSPDLEFSGVGSITTDTKLEAITGFTIQSEELSFAWSGVCPLLVGEYGDGSVLYFDEQTATNLNNGDHGTFIISLWIRGGKEGEPFANRLDSHNAGEFDTSFTIPFYSDGIKYTGIGASLYITKSHPVPESNTFILLSVALAGLILKRKVQLKNSLNLRK